MTVKEVIINDKQKESLLLLFFGKITKKNLVYQKKKKLKRIFIWIEQVTNNREKKHD